MGRDIDPTMGTLVFPPGSRVGVISVSIVDDSVVEAEEQFILELMVADVEAVTISGRVVEVTITDDDGEHVSPALKCIYMNLGLGSERCES